MPSSVRSSIIASADVVVGVSVRSLLEVLIDPVNINAPAPSDNIVRSLSPVELNSPAAQTSITNLLEQALPASAAEEPRALQAIPTADYVLRSGFKTDSKLVIKIVPMTKGGASQDAVANKLDKITPELTFNQFSLQAIAEVDDERYQLHELFEGSLLYLFGRRPRVWTMQGIVANGKRVTFIPQIRDRVTGVMRDRTPSEKLDYRRRYDMDFANELMRRWDAYYRGSRAVELRARTFMAYDDVIIEATLLGLTCSRNAQVPTAVNASLTFVVHERAFFGQQPTEFTEANVKELLAKTLVFKNKLTASQVLPPNITSDQLRNLHAAAQAEALDAQAENAAAQERLQGTKDSLAQAQINESFAKDEEGQAQQDIASADAAIADAIANGDPVAEEQARAAKTAAESELVASRQRQQEARAAQQKLSDQLVDDEEAAGAAVAAQEDAISKANALAAILDQAGDTSDIPVVDEIVASVLRRTGGTEVGHSIVDSTSTYIVVEVVYRDQQGALRSERVRRALT